MGIRPTKSKGNTISHRRVVNQKRQLECERLQALLSVIFYENYLRLKVHIAKSTAATLRSMGKLDISAGSDQQCQRR